MTYEEEGKGKGTGKWWASVVPLCSFAIPRPSCPKGRLDDCSGFRRAGQHYYLGGAKLTLLTP